MQTGGVGRVVDELQKVKKEREKRESKTGQGQKHNTAIERVRQVIFEYFDYDQGHNKLIMLTQM